MRCSDPRLRIRLLLIPPVVRLSTSTQNSIDADNEETLSVCTHHSKGVPLFYAAKIAGTSRMRRVSVEDSMFYSLSYVKPAEEILLLHLTASLACNAVLCDQTRSADKGRHLDNIKRHTSQ